MKKKILLITARYTWLALLMLLNNSICEGQQKVIEGKPFQLQGPFAHINSIYELDINKEFNTTRLIDKKEDFENENDEDVEPETENFNTAKKASDFKIPDTHNPFEFINQNNKVTSLSPGNYNFMGNDNVSNPSDATGAVGLDFIVSLANGEARIIRKSTGLPIVVMPINSFFNKTNYGDYDPRILYDPYGKRFVAIDLMCEIANSKNCQCAIAVSDTSDPTLGWSYYGIEAALDDSCSFDFPYLGFNKDWIAIKSRIGQHPNGTYPCDATYDGFFLLNKGELYNNNNLVTGFSYPNFGGTPAFTYDNASSDLFLADSWSENNNGLGTIHIHKISGSVNPSLTLANYTLTTTPWQAKPNQNCFDYSNINCGRYPPQLGSTEVRDDGGHGINSNVVYRNGKIYFSHSINLPASGITNRQAVQWWKVDASTGVVDTVVRIDDPTGSVCSHHPSISVNTLGDVCLGYSVSSHNFYPSAAYTYYNATGGGGSSVYKNGGNMIGVATPNTWNQHRWGDYSATMVDPIDDKSFWTVNEIINTQPYDRATWWGLIPEYIGCSTLLLHPTITYYGNAKYEASNRIASGRIIAGSSIVDYDAGDSITLQAGFEAREGTIFHAYIDGCGGAIQQNGQQKVVSSAMYTENSLREKYQVLAFPNPAQNQITFEYSLQKETTLSSFLYDSQLRLISTGVSKRKAPEGKQSYTIDIKPLNNGLYLCKSIVGDDVLFTRFVVNK